MVLFDTMECGVAHPEGSHDAWSNEHVRQMLLRGPNYVYSVHKTGRREMKMRTYAPIRSETEPCDHKGDCP